jgi:hypothetical protein
MCSGVKLCLYRCLLGNINQVKQLAVTLVRACHYAALRFLSTPKIHFVFARPSVSQPCRAGRRVHYPRARRRRSHRRPAAPRPVWPSRRPHLPPRNAPSRPRLARRGQRSRSGNRRRRKRTRPPPSGSLPRARSAPSARCSVRSPSSRPPRAARAPRSRAGTLGRTAATARA